MKISIINLVAFFAIVIAVEAYKEDKGFWDDFYILQNRERGVDLIVDSQIEKILEEVGFNTRGHQHKRRNQIIEYTLCIGGSWAENSFPRTGQRAGEETPSSLLAVWMGSADHRATIKDSQNRYVGCARGRSGSNYSYLCAFRRANIKDTPQPYTCSNHAFGSSRGISQYSRCYLPKCN